MKVIVIGAAGATGRLVVAEAVRAGHSVTAFVRDAVEFEAGVRVITGDAADVATATKALEGQDAVIDTVGGGSPWKDEGLESSVAHSIVRSMVKTGVRRLVAISAMGVGDSQANAPFWWEYILMPTLYRGVMPDKTRMEREFVEGDIDYVIARPALLSNDEDAPPLRVVEDDEKVRKTTRKDLARFLVEQVDSDKYVGRSVVVANDRLATEAARPHSPDSLPSAALSSKVS